VDDVGLLGQVRFTASSSFDWGLQLGFADAGDGAALIGGDIRPILKRADSEFPLDLAFDAGIGLLIPRSRRAIGSSSRDRTARSRRTARSDSTSTT
jgi:hypothetical protein